MALSMQELAERVREALTAGALDAYPDLLDPDVRWGPAEDPQAGCRNRGEVLSWYQAGRDRGVRAVVTEVVVGEDSLLVGLSVSGPPAAGAPAGSVPRWQVLTVRAGRITDIRGFEDRDQAAARARVAD